MIAVSNLYKIKPGYKICVSFKQSALGSFYSSPHGLNTLIDVILWSYKCRNNVLLSFYSMVGLLEHTCC